MPAAAAAAGRSAGAGKAIVALQRARHVASSGGTATFPCYEHAPATLLLRLLALELADAGDVDGSLTSELATLLADGSSAGTHIEEVFRSHPRGPQVLARVRRYADRLVLVRA